MEDVDSSPALFSPNVSPSLPLFVLEARGHSGDQRSLKIKATLNILVPHTEDTDVPEHAQSYRNSF